MEEFLTKHAEKIVGTISCFDRVNFKGYLPLSWAKAMEQFMAQHGVLIKDFKRFVEGHSERVVSAAKVLAEQVGRPYKHLSGPADKDALAREIAERDGVTEGLVCVLAAVEGCQSFKMVYGEGRPRLKAVPRKCLCLYFYFVDRVLGFLHVRIQSWFPFTVQVCLNGHSWLARQMDRHGIAYRRQDNAFHWIEDPARAQRLADRFVRKRGPRVLSALARRVNPLVGNWLGRMDYYWVTDQAEYATDVLFRDPPALRPLYENLLRHATLCFGAEDVMTFLGRRLTAGFAGEIVNHATRRWPGARVKHQMKENWIKMYDKHGSILRVETVINNPREFRIRRWGTRRGQPHLGWYPMAKGVATLYRYAEVARASNRRYLSALASLEDPSEAIEQLEALAQPVRREGRSYRGFNPASPQDANLFAAVLRGEHTIKGLRNRDVGRHLYPATKDPVVARRQSARVTRLLQRLHAHGLIAKIPRSRRWRLTQRGHALMSCMLKLHRQDYLQTLSANAA